MRDRIIGSSFRGFEIRALIVVGLLAGLVCGCGSTIQRPGGAVAAAPSLSSGQKADAIEVALSPQAASALSPGTALDEARIAEAIRRALSTRGAMGEAGEPSLPVVSVVVTDLRLRSTAAAILIGFLEGEDRQVAQVTLKSDDGRVLQAFEASATYAFGGLAGLDSTRIDWLVGRLAEEIAAEMTGKAAG